MSYIGFWLAPYHKGDAQDDSDSKKGEGAIEGSNKSEDESERLRDTEALLYSTNLVSLLGCT